MGRYTKINLNTVKSNKNKVRSYIFDWDDNILYMPTKILMEKMVSKQWIAIEVSTREYSKIRNNKKYRFRDNDFISAFVNFDDSKVFLKDVKLSIDKNFFAPSFEKFKEALIYANKFAINTARGHSPNTIKRGVKLLIKYGFTSEEKNIMIKNIKKHKFLNINETNPDKIINKYLTKMGEYYPVSSKEFIKRFSSGNEEITIEEGKRRAIYNFVKNIVKNTNNSHKKTNRISIGFSDDDKRNISSITEYLSKELKHKYPNIHFVIYDTSNGEKNKLVIETGL